MGNLERKAYEQETNFKAMDGSMNQQEMKVDSLLEHINQLPKPNENVMVRYNEGKTVVRRRIETVEKLFLLDFLICSCES